MTEGSEAEHPPTKPQGISAVVLAYGDEPHLGECIDALLRSDAKLEIILVDNGAGEAVAALPAAAALRIIRPAENLGFAGGCNLGVANATGEVIVFVNSDVRVAPDALSELGGRLADPLVGLASACVRLAEEPELVNSIGNPAQFLLFSWAGGYGDLAAAHACPKLITSVSGATFAVRRKVWEQLEGFDSRYFAYGEDLDLSLRAWQAGYQVVYVPTAVSWHWYEFSRNPLKLYLLERNRLITLLTVFEIRTLLRAAPSAIAVEAGVMAMAIRDGWARQKWDGWRWIWRHRDELRERRHRIQSTRVIGDDALLPLLQGPINPPAGFGFAVPKLVNLVLEKNWNWMRLRGQRELR